MAMPRQAVGAALVAALLCSAPARGAEPVRLLDVPFLSQPPALCGGAAVAMVGRYWGVADLTAEDFASARTAAGDGIAAAALADAARRHGLRAEPFHGDAPSVRSHLAQGRPLVALLG